MNALNPIPHSNTLPEGFTLLAVPSTERNSPTRMFEDLPDVLKTQQVADALQISTKTVRELANRKELEGFRVASTWRFSKANLIKFVSRKEKEDD